MFHSKPGASTAGRIAEVCKSPHFRKGTNGVLAGRRERGAFHSALRGEKNYLASFIESGGGNLSCVFQDELGLASAV